MNVPLDLSCSICNLEFAGRDFLISFATASCNTSTRCSGVRFVLVLTAPGKVGDACGRLGFALGSRGFGLGVFEIGSTISQSFILGLFYSPVQAVEKYGAGPRADPIRCFNGTTTG